jgi:DNA-binding transcriptional LysR family regulator
MEFGQLEAFERVARDGSFTRAADALGLTQPAVSTRITTLEAELGGPLFERKGRRLQLTPMGEALLPYAQRLLLVKDESLQAVNNVKQGRMGAVKVAAPGPFVLSFLIDVLETFRRQYPSVDVLIRERNKTTIIDMLHDNTMTLGVVNAPVFDPYLQQLARFRDPIRAVTSPRHPLAKRQGKESRISMEALYNYTIFRVSMFPEMTAFMDALVEQGRRGSGGAVIAVPMVMAYRLVTLGQGMTFLPEYYVHKAVEAGELVYLQIDDMPALVSEPVLVCHKERRLDRPHEEFVRVFKRVVSNE